MRLVAAFEPFDALARERGQVRPRGPWGRGTMGVISARDTFDLIKTTLPTRPWLLTKAEVLGVASPNIVPEAVTS